MISILPEIQIFYIENYSKFLSTAIRINLFLWSRKKILLFFPDFKITKDFSTRHAIMIQNLCQSTTFCALGPQNYQEFFQAIQKISSCGYPGTYCVKNVFIQHPLYEVKLP